MSVSIITQTITSRTNEDWKRPETTFRSGTSRSPRYQPQGDMMSCARCRGNGSSAVGEEPSAENQLPGQLSRLFGLAGVQPFGSRSAKGDMSLPLDPNQQLTNEQRVDMAYRVSELTGGRLSPQLVYMMLGLGPEATTASKSDMPPEVVRGAAELMDSLSTLSDMGMLNSKGEQALNLLERFFENWLNERMASGEGVAEDEGEEGEEGGGRCGRRKGGGRGGRGGGGGGRIGGGGGISRGVGGGKMKSFVGGGDPLDMAIMALLMAYKDVSEELRSLANQVQQATANANAMRTQLGNMNKEANPQAYAKQEMAVQNASDDRQMLMFQLQVKLQEWTQLMNMVTNAAKVGHDARMSVIRNFK